MEDKESEIEAIEQAREATEATEELENVLKHTLNINNVIDWEALKDRTKFSKPKPEPPQLLNIPQPPKGTDSRYQPKLGLFYKLLSSRKQNKIKQNKINSAKLLFKKDYDNWMKQKEETLKRNAELEEQYQNELKQWETEEQGFLKRQQEKNYAIDKLKEPYLSKIPDAIVDYCEIVLLKSDYPDYFPQEFDTDYNPETKILIVDYSLPSVDSIPKLKEVKYIKSKDKFVKVFHTESFINKLYDSLVCQIALRTIHELYESDVVNAIDSIVFNGWVKSIDKATGHEVNACILSVQANRQEFLSINLTNVDPKACFRHLKGVGSSKLHSLTPVAPIFKRRWKFKIT